MATEAVERGARWRRKCWQWCRRYLPAELAGTAYAFIGTTLICGIFADRAAVAFAGTVSENVGFYGVLAKSLETGNQLRFPVRDELDSPHRTHYQLTGPTCDSQDTILLDVRLFHDLSTGDRVYLGSVGAYTTVYASSFNGFYPPTIHYVAGRPSSVLRNGDSQ